MSLRWTLLAPQLLIAAAIAAYIYGVWTPGNLAQAQKVRFELIDRHLQTVEDGVAPLLLSRQLDVIQENLTALLQQNPDWASVQLFDNQGRRLYPTPAYVVDRPQAAEALRRTVVRDISHLGALIGKLVVVFDTGPGLGDDRLQSERLLHLVLGLLGGMLIVTMLTLELAVRRPLKQLSEALTALGRENYSAPLPESRTGEVGALSRSFAAMRDCLRSSRTELLHEIAERRQAEQKYREVFQHVSDSLIIFEPGGPHGFHLADINPAGKRLCEICKATDCERLSMECIAGHEQGRLRKLFLECAETGRAASCEHRLENTTPPRVLETILLPVRNEAGSVYRIIMFSADVTERRQAEEQARKLNAELEARVARRTEALEQANRELEAFSYSVSHDLRAPLRAIHGYSLIVIEDYGERLDGEGRRLLDVILKNSERMAQLIDDLLSFSRASRLDLKHEIIDMGAMIQEVFDELTETLPPRKISLRLGPLPPARGDRAMIRQVLRNLIGNAIKFTARREEAAIDVSCSVSGTGNTYRVKDNGAGFDPQLGDKLFGVFERLHSNEEFEGTGIGLAIVKRIIERHGGQVRADGQVGEGATMEFTLPAEPH